MTVLYSLRREAAHALALLRSSVAFFGASTMSTRLESSLVPRRVLILAKVSRYDFERLRQPELSEQQIEAKLLERGADSEAMLDSHRRNKAAVNGAVAVLKKLRIEYRLTDRLSIDQVSFDWADLILAIGGDGTFLLGANLVFDNVKPIIGINSDPATSEGYLMLPPEYTNDVAAIFHKLRNGCFEYLMRSRIRVTLGTTGTPNPPFHMHEKGRVLGKERYRPYYADKDCRVQSNFHTDDERAVMNVSSLQQDDSPRQQRLPWLALNEVFIGESMSARTSSLNIRINGGPNFHKVKSSGLCVSTGTGSSSWYRAINSLTPNTVRDVLRIAIPGKEHGEDEIKRICEEFNEGLEFAADDRRMSYAIRDIIVNDIWPLPRTIAPRDFCTSMTVQSQCYDAGLILDGGIGVPFNVGTTAFLTVDPEDALRTIVLK